MGVAFHFADKPTTQWRGPLGLALIWPALMIVVTFLSPESPRWLLLKGRTEEAKAVTHRLHATKRDHTYADEEFNQMVLQTEIDSKLETSWVSHGRGFKPKLLWYLKLTQSQMSMFTKPSYRKRVLIICWMCFIGQSTGQ